MRTTLQEARRIIIKVGTSTLTHDTGRLNLERIEQLVRQIANLSNQGKEVVLVSSGAVGAGLPLLGLQTRPTDIATKQAAAAVGQGVLLHIYEKLFREYGLVVGQVLLTREDTVHKHRFVNLRSTLLSLLKLGVVPIINENDVVAVDELKIGDNDTLSAFVASAVDGDLLIIASDIDGLYTANPHTHPDAELIPTVESLTPDIWALAGGAGSALGTGGMITKLEAARIATNSGTHMVIANGSQPHMITAVAAGEDVGTWFVAHKHPHMYKRWVAFGTRLKGAITVDAGCAKAIREAGSSILAVGVTGVSGDFAEGETVRVMADGQEIARGIVNFSSEDLQRIQGLKTEDIPKALGIRSAYDEVIHRDNLVVFAG